MSDSVAASIPAAADRTSWRMRVSRSMMPVFIGLTAALLALAIVIAQTIFAQREARVRAMNEGSTLIALQTVLQNMVDAETSQRGYVLTGDRAYLEPYLAAKQRLGPAIADLRGVADRVGDDETTSRINWIANMTDAKFAELDRTVALTRAGLRPQAEMIIGSNLGKEQMDAIRAAIAGETARKADLREAAFARASKLEKRLIPLIVVLSAAILALVFAGFRAERSRAAAAAEAAQADALRAANERTELLARELNHRVKNLFSVILAIVTLSGRKEAPAREMVDNIRARIHALSLAHAASQGAAGETSVPLGPVVAKTLEPYVDEEGLRVRIAGPEVEMPVRMITPIGMIIHELATNAVKYGALSIDGGAVDVRWERISGPAVEELTLSWIESGGPALSFADHTPTHAGFGSQMTRLAANQLGGSIVRQWPPSGAVVRLTFPLPAAPRS